MAAVSKNRQRFTAHFLSAMEFTPLLLLYYVLMEVKTCCFSTIWLKYFWRNHGSYEWIIMLEKCGCLDLTVFHLICVIGSYGSWENQNPVSCFEVTSPFTSKTGFWFFWLPWVPNLHFSWNPLLYGRPHFFIIQL